MATNIIESRFAAVRLRTLRSEAIQEGGERDGADLENPVVVEQHFRKLNAPHLCTTMYDGMIYRDGVRVIRSTRELRAA